jgi:hypothetical protein
MKQTLKTVYIPVNHDGNQCIHSPNVGFLEKQELITFNVKEFNKFISEIIKDSLNTVTNNVTTKFIGFTDNEEIDMESITNTFEETFEKFKT